MEKQKIRGHSNLDQYASYLPSLSTLYILLIGLFNWCAESKYRLSKDCYYCVFY
jgi:hypothetical protein